MLFASRKEKVVEKDLRVCRTILDRTCGFLAGDCWAFVRRLKPRNRRELRIGGSSRANSEPISAIHPKGGPAGRGIKQWSLCQSRCGNLCRARPISEERRQKQGPFRWALDFGCWRLVHDCWRATEHPVGRRTVRYESPFQHGVRASLRALGETTLGVVREGADEEQPAKLWSHVGML
ncbi:hypothetical protein CpipJ_CPIJ007379 [Culex quinquefasciatus]|uniref:Uncharacterized protein n=1 Tax=Culex quinquefasciatus TaxID=7176 RepID=B0WJE3_CULQU|nr:hypothetical protein CpipJ_CPIJ007379 [Culex quinquefasciatus]|eukprot:XP_001848827.1 hypothetical protein CpipJ_CPIJ007379 [Culex quinquefasciatus]